MGKSKSVANSSVVSSTDTVSTQSNVSPSGSDSNTFTVRSRTSDSRLRTLPGAPIDRTVLRCAVCSGGSIEINGVIRWNIELFSGVGRSPSVMPFADEKFCQSPSMARTSS